MLVLIVFAAQLTGGILSFVFRDQLTGIIEEGLNGTLSRYGVNTSSSTANKAITDSWDFVQETVGGR